MSNIKIALTVMVRDEADIISQMLEHHIAQGVEVILVCDNGSTDGTFDILSQYKKRGLIQHLSVDPNHNKQQSTVVTNLARIAATQYGADWVINADADEFWVAENANTLYDALLSVPKGIESYNVKVSNLFAHLGSDDPIFDAIWEDVRTQNQLWQVGIHNHPTHNCVHRGNGEIYISQGNHFTSSKLAESASVPKTAALQVFHIPYRSYAQYVKKVQNTQSAYTNAARSSSPRKPSPLHHTMRDARFLDADILDAFFAARFPHKNLQISYNTPPRPETHADHTPPPPGFVHNPHLQTLLTKLRSNARIKHLFNAPYPASTASISQTPAFNASAALAKYNTVHKIAIEKEHYFVRLQEEIAKNTSLTAENTQLKSQNSAYVQDVENLKTALQNTFNTACGLVDSPIPLLYSKLITPHKLSQFREHIVHCKNAYFSTSSLESRPNTHITSTDATPNPDEHQNGENTQNTKETFKKAKSQMLQILHCPPHKNILLNTHDPTIPVIMCLWNRKDRIDSILLEQSTQHLIWKGTQKSQTSTPKIRLMLWNNQIKDADFYTKRIEAFVRSGSHGSLAAIELINSPHNIRGIGRFLTARMLLDEGCTGVFIMLDDDQKIKENAIDTLIRAYQPRSISSTWAWKVSAHDYWDRTKALPGESVNYAATGGCVADLSLVANNLFFTQIPIEGIFLEDIWMSHYAAYELGWALSAVDLDFEFVMQEQNQYQYLIDHKIQFWNLLQHMKGRTPTDHTTD